MKKTIGGTTITWSNNYQEIKYDHEVPKKVLDDYDWLEEEDKSSGWLKYRKTWYHLSDFMRLDKNSPFGDEWQGYHSDSAFSGVLIKFSECGDGAILGSYYS